MGQFSMPGSTLLTATVNAFDGAPWSDAPPTKGDLTRRFDYLLGESRYVVTQQNGYDSYGNLTSTYDATNRGGAVSLDPAYHSYPISATNGAGEITSTGWGDYRCGVPATTTDANGLITTFGTDQLCRPTTTTVAGFGVVATRSYLNLGNPATQNVTVDSPGPDGALDSSASYFDGYGRTYRSEKRGPEHGGVDSHRC